jgi:hypothetical protein
MSIVTRWPMLLAVSGSLTFPTLLRSKRYKEGQAQNAGLHEWENEGGNIAAEASNTVSTTGSA